jgi:putative toxin-antitoxin system antitoxin component (TIGR02293 family)
MNAIPDRIARIFAGPEPLGRMPRTIDDWRELVQIGIPIEALNNLSNMIAPSPEQGNAFAHVIFETPDRLRYFFYGRPSYEAADEKLTSPESERAERIARLYAMAEEVLGSEKEARDFLFSRHEKLDGQSPIDWMRTEIGGRNVEQLLINIREAFPS